MSLFPTEPRGWSVFDLAARHRRALFLEKELLRQLAGWFTAVPQWEIKHRMGYDAWNHAEHAQWLTDRLENLRGGNPEANLDPDFMNAVRRNVDAPTPEAFLGGIYLVLLPLLVAEYEETLAGADGAANAFDRRMLSRIIPETREQIDWARAVLDEDAESAPWATHLHGLLEAGSTTTVPAKAFRLPDSIIFDERVGELPITPHEEKMKLPYEARVVEQFRVFFNEIYAAAILSTVVYEAFDQASGWPMIYWFARHFWDEVRHSQFGAARLAELGTAPDRCDQSLFRNARRMPFVHRVCYLTLVLEKHYMPRKKPRFEEYGEAGDLRSRLFADHDWSDEMNHVRNGRQWLEVLLEGDARGVEDIQDETMAILEDLAGAPVAAVSPF